MPCGQRRRTNLFPSEGDPPQDEDDKGDEGGGKVAGEGEEAEEADNGEGGGDGAVLEKGREKGVDGEGEGRDKDEDESGGAAGRRGREREREEWGRGWCPQGDVWCKVGFGAVGEEHVQSLRCSRPDDHSPDRDDNGDQGGSDDKALPRRKHFSFHVNTEKKGPRGRADRTGLRGCAVLAGRLWGRSGRPSGTWGGCG